VAHFRQLHDWDLSPREAAELQRTLREQLLFTAPAGPIETIAGADISFDKYSTTLFAAVVVVRLETMETIEERGVVAETHFPYVPGLLSFRETPPILEAWKLLECEPDALMVDGHGIAHPRRAGIASHLGLLVERPSFGCAKSILVGSHEEPAPERGSMTPLVDKGEQVGVALRTRTGVSPIYVTPGHLVDLQTAIRLTLASHGGYRQPEPTRRAHNLVNAMRRNKE
jgi:deoxyribonuclease V